MPRSLFIVFVLIVPAATSSLMVWIMSIRGTWQDWQLATIFLVAFVTLASIAWLSNKTMGARGHNGGFSVSDREND